MVPTESGIVVTADNLGEEDHNQTCNPSGDYKCATGFTTGGASNGYTLDAVNLQLGATVNGVNDTGNLGNIRVALHASATSTQGDLKAPAATALATLATPTGDNPDTAGTYAFECSGSGCNLAPNTAYFIQVDATAGSRLNLEYYIWRPTASSAETLEPTGNGWSLANETDYHIGGAWEVISGEAGKMKITATTR